MLKIKAAIFLLLCNRLTGALLVRIFDKVIPDIRWRKFRFSVNSEVVSKKQIASIFWGFYESAEIRLIEKYLQSKINVIELGGSIGVVSSHIAHKMDNGFRLICIEANPLLINVIEKNLNSHKSPGVFTNIVNCAISYNVEHVHLSLTNNHTETHVEKHVVGSGNDIIVKARTLDSIIKEFSIEDFALVCDIEGSEIEILLNEKFCLQRCKQLFIELHETTYKGFFYSVDDIVAIIENSHGLVMQARNGPVIYFRRR